MKPAIFIAYVSMFTALTAVATALIQIPVPQTRGYINLGDTMVIFSGLLLGPLAGFIIGSIGSAIADVATGYAHWAPFTFAIKGLEGFIVGALSRKGEKIALLGTVIGGATMVLGYFVVEYFLYGPGAPIAELPGNIFQAGSGIAFGNAVNRIVGRVIREKLG